LERASPLNSPPHNSWPVVRLATVTSTRLYKHMHKKYNNKSQYLVFLNVQEYSSVQILCHNEITETPL
jgi:hypothetical protein